MSTAIKQKRRGREINMLEGNIASAMIRFAIPVIFTGILQNLYNTADTIVVGNFGGTTALASVGATATTVSLLVNIAVNVFVGMNIILARQLGARDDESARTTCRTGYVTSLGLGLLILILGQVLAIPLLNLTKCPEGEVFEGAVLYLRIYFAGMPALMFNNYAASVLRMSGDSRTPFIYLSISGAINVIFNVVFVLLFGNPVAGVALATILSMYVSTVQFAIHLIKLDGPCRLEPFKLSFDSWTFGKIIRYGIPSCVSTATFSVTNIMIQPAINAFGEVGMSGSTASISVEAYLYSITGAFNSAVVSFMGQNIGAGNKERTVKVLKTGYVLTSIIMVFFTAAIIGFGRNILWLFIPGETEAIEFAQLRLTFIMSAAICNGVMNVNNAALQAYGFTVGQMISNLIGVCLFRIIWMTLIYPANPVAWLLWLCYPVSWFLTAAIVFCVVIVLTRKYLNGRTFKI